MTDPLQGLEDVDWGELHTYRGTAVGVPHYLRRMVSDDAEQRALGARNLRVVMTDSQDCDLNCQAAPAIVPFLIRIAASGVPERTRLLWFVGEIVAPVDTGSGLGDVPQPPRVLPVDRTQRAEWEAQLSQMPFITFEHEYHRAAQDADSLQATWGEREALLRLASEDDSPQARCAAAILLCQAAAEWSAMGAEVPHRLVTLEGLAARLSEDADPQVRACFALALARAAEPDEVGELLTARLEAEVDPNTRAAVAGALQAAVDPPAGSAAYLIAHLCDGEGEVPRAWPRLNLVPWLAPHPGTREALLAIARGVGSAARAQALRFLRWRVPAEDVVELLGALLDDDEPQVALEACAVALSSEADSEALRSPWAGWLGHAEPGLQLAAREALVALLAGDPSADDDYDEPWGEREEDEDDSESQDEDGPPLREPLRAWADRLAEAACSRSVDLIAWADSPALRGRILDVLRQALPYHAKGEGFGELRQALVEADWVADPSMFSATCAVLKRLPVDDSLVDRLLGLWEDERFDRYDLGSVLRCRPLRPEVFPRLLELLRSELAAGTLRDEHEGLVGWLRGFPGQIEQALPELLQVKASLLLEPRSDADYIFWDHFRESESAFDRVVAHVTDDSLEGPLRVRVLSWLTDLRVGRARVVEVLLELSNGPDRKLHHVAAKALVKLGPEHALGGVSQLLSKGNTEAVLGVLEGLYYNRSDWREAKDALLPLVAAYLAHAEEDLRLDCLYTLREIRWRDAATDELVLERILDAGETPDVKARAIGWSFGELDPVPHYERLLAEGPLQLRAAAMNALARGGLDLTPARAGALIASYLGHEEAGLRGTAIRALRFYRGWEDSAPLLAEALDDERPDLRLLKAGLLFHIAPVHAQEVSESLRGLIEDPLVDQTPRQRLVLRGYARGLLRDVEAKLSAG